MAARSTPLAPPLSISHYELSGRVGAGQTGLLYRARDTHTQSFVAIQIIPADLVERNHFDRLNAEFQRASPLEHPNILRLIDFGRESGFIYIVTEWIEGTVLSQMIQAHTRLAEDISIRIVAQIAQAIDYLLINNYATFRVRNRKIVIRTDGVAKLVSFAPASGCLPSSPMPGLALSSASPLDAPVYDPKTTRVEDPVYSLGATLFEMVTGREFIPPPPSSGEQPEASQQRSSSRNSSRRRRPVTPRRIPGLTERVEAAILRAIDDDHTKRPGSCAEFVTILYGRSRATGSAKADVRPLAPDQDNRRAHVRYALGVGTSATIHDSVLEPPLPDGPKSQEIWPLVIRDISAGGVGILLARRCEVGTELLIEMVAGPNRKARSFPVRVVRVKRENHGHWAHGCQFLQELDEQQVNALLDCSMRSSV
ncbi:MAG TPA: protein kinase [Gemmata sp.]|nr:protein kinase [Gemmata sp.]